MAGEEDIIKELADRLREYHRQNFSILGTVNDVEKTISRMRNEVMLIDKEIIEKLDGLGETVK